mgnify:CR=1 FL=1
MKCGICGKANHTNGMPFFDGRDLNGHKRREHPEAMRAARIKQHATREAKGLREARIASAVQAAAAQATGVVLHKWRDSAPYQIESIADRANAERYPAYHVAEPEWYAHWQDLAVDAAEALEQAYQQGRPITEADVERVRLAVAEARQKAEEEA